MIKRIKIRDFKINVDPARLDKDPIPRQLA